MELGVNNFLDSTDYPTGKEFMVPLTSHMV